MEIISQPIMINRLRLKNRLVMPPMATAKSASGGLVSPDLGEYYRERALYSRIGMIITEHSYVSLQGKAGRHQLSMASDDVLKGMRTLTDTIHETDVAVVAQISHAGSRAEREVVGCDPVGPSPLIHPNAGKNPLSIPHELTKEEIKGIVSDFVPPAAAISGHVIYGAPDMGKCIREVRP